jgi:hypothetical protein
MKLTLRKDMAKRIAAQLLQDACELELTHRTPTAGESFMVRPLIIERQIARLRRWARLLAKATA